jgi:hypothetical protein
MEMNRVILKFSGTVRSINRYLARIVRSGGNQDDDGNDSGTLFLFQEIRTAIIIVCRKKRGSP